MKILHISKFYPPEPGGIENFVCDLAGAQAKKGHDVCVLAHQAEFNQPTRWERVNGVNLGRVRSFGELAHAPVTPEFPLQLLPLLSRFRPDVIHAHLPNLSAFWLLFIKKSCPLVLHWHADVVSSLIDRKMRMLYRLYKPWELLLLKKADRIIATSDAYLNTSRPLSGFKEKIRVIPLGLHPARLAGGWSVRETAGPNAAFTVLSVGRFAYYKGFEYLVEAAEKVPEANFILVGGGPRYPDIQKRVARKGLQGRIQLPGRVTAERLKELFSDCDLFCLPSVERTEAFGMVLLEAMSLGKPLVTTKVAGSGMSEVNVNGSTGLQVPPADADALADALNTLKHAQQLRLQMGEQARRRFEAHFHISFVAEQIESFYEIL